VCRRHATYPWKTLYEGYNFASYKKIEEAKQRRGGEINNSIKLYIKLGD
jgi:hypothetical protein